MKKYSLDETLGQIRQMPESISYEDIAKFAIAAPVITGSTFGLLKLIIKWLHFKYIVPMFFTSTTAGLVVWYAVQSSAPVSSIQSSPDKIPVKSELPIIINMNKDVPMSGSTLFTDTTKKQKKIIRKEERRIYSDGDGSGQLAPLPPLPPMPEAPVEPGSKRRTEVRKEIEEISSEGGKKKADKGCGEDDAFIKAMLDQLQKDGLLKNRQTFTLLFQPDQLTVDGNSGTKVQIDKLLKLYQKIEKDKFGKGSLITISKSNKNCSLSKSVGNE